MASLESLLSRSYASQTMTGRVQNDKCVAIEIVPVGTDVTRSVTLTSASDLTLVNNAVLDPTNGTVVATFGDTTGGTLGQVVDTINGGLYFKARVLDGLRSSVTTGTTLLPNSAVTATTINGESVYQIFHDTSEMDAFYYRVAADRGVNYNDFGILKENLPLGSRRMKITGLKYLINCAADVLGGLKIYEYDPKSLTETLIWQKRLIDNVETTLDFTDNPFISKGGNEFIVSAAEGTITTGILNFLEVNYIRE